MSKVSNSKSYDISKHDIMNAWLRVKKNGGFGGVDDEGLAKFESNLKKNLYKVWNRMSSGSYFPQAVKRVEIPKEDGTMRPLARVSLLSSQNLVPVPCARSVIKNYKKVPVLFNPRVESDRQITNNGCKKHIQV